MASAIKTIFDGKREQGVHDEFVKFSRGVFDNRYMIDAKKQPGKYSIKTSAEFVNYLVRAGLAKANGPVKITGVIVATFNVKEDAEFEISGIKQFMGIKQAVVDTIVEPSKVIALMDRQPKAFYALSFVIDDFELKTKAKAPKSAKPSTKGEGDVKVDFCSLKTNDKNIIDDLFFGIDIVKEVSIRHSIQINEIILPKGEKDPVKIRENAIRKGKIVRTIVFDGKNQKIEKDFEA